MDVSCERCRTEYEFDEARLTDSGVAVKCASCGHIFLVRKPLRAGGMAPVAPEKPREWMLRKPGQAPVTFRELTSLQKWIVEGKVGRGDEISLKGDVWKPLGEIPELSPFFKVLDDAQRATQPEANVLPFTPPSPGTGEPAWAQSPPVAPNLASAPAFAPVPQALGMPSPERPPMVQAPMPRPQLVPESPPIAPMKVAEPQRGLPKLPVALGLVAIGVGAFFVGRMYRQQGMATTPAVANVRAAPTPPAPTVPTDSPDRDAVKSALAQGPLGANALKLVNGEQAPAATPTHAQTAEALVQAGQSPANPEKAPGGTPPQSAAASSPTRAPGAAAPAETMANAPKVPAAHQAGATSPSTPRTGEAQPAESRGDGAAQSASPAQPALGKTTATPAASPEVASVTAAQAPARAEGSSPGSAPAAQTPPPSGTGGTPQGAVALAAPASTANPKGPDAKPKPPAVAHDYDWYVLHADRLRQAGHTEAAVDLYQKALALKPDRAEPIAGLGLAELDLGENDAAQVEFGKALSLNPGYSVAVMGMAEAYEAQGKNADAIRFYERFLELEPSGEEARAARASIARLKQP